MVTVYAGRGREAADRHPQPLFTALNFGEETDPGRVTATWPVCFLEVVRHFL